MDFNPLAYRIADNLKIEHMKDLGMMPKGKLFEYIFGRNGVYVRAEREGLRAMIPVFVVDDPSQEIRGLIRLEKKVDVLYRVPADFLRAFVKTAAWKLPNESLAYIEYFHQKQRAIFPKVIATETSVRPVDNSSCEMAFLEIHSHGLFDAFFSHDDNEDEKQGFRIYTVIGNIDPDGTRCEILTRIGIYGYFCCIPSEWVYELPQEICFTTPLPF